MKQSGDCTCMGSALWAKGFSCGLEFLLGRMLLSINFGKSLHLCSCAYYFNTTSSAHLKSSCSVNGNQHGAQVLSLFTPVAHASLFTASLVWAWLAAN